MANRPQWGVPAYGIREQYPQQSMTFHPPPHPHPPPHSHTPQQPINYHTFQQQQDHSQEPNQWTGMYPQLHPPSIPSQQIQLKEEDLNTPDTSYESFQEGEVEFDPVVLCEERPSRRRRNVVQPTTSIVVAPIGRRASKSKGKGKPKSNSSADTISTQIEPSIQAPIIHPPEPVEQITAIFLPDPYQPHIQLKGVNKSGLLPAPQGSILDVNDLLILHPPARETHGLGHTSQYEMYTCRVCSKTYDGKNARSVARRHLQDKHGVPLAVQKRRSRWDYEPDRPKTKQDAKERNLKSKREWANKNRQIQKLERTQAPFLERFGPEGIITPCGMRLIAPKFRGPVANMAQPGLYLDGAGGNLIIPENILREVQAIRGLELGFGSNCKSYKKENLEEETAETMIVEEEAPAVRKGKGKGQGKKQARVQEQEHGKGRGQNSRVRNQVMSRTTSQTDVSTRSNTPLNAISDEAPSPANYHSNHQNFSAPIGTSRQAIYYHQSFPQFNGWQGDNSSQPASMPVSNGRYAFAYAPTHGLPFQGQHSIPQHLLLQYQQYQQMDEPFDEEEGVVAFDEQLPIDPALQDDQESSTLPSSPEEVGPLPEQQWVPSQSWETVREGPQAILEPALDISQRWEGLLLTGAGWGSSDDGEMNAATAGEDHRAKEGSIGTEGEAVAAESLLNLHSTPLRGPEEGGRNEIQLAKALADLDSSTGSRNTSKLGLRFGSDLSASTSSSTSAATLCKDKNTEDAKHQGSRSGAISVLTKGWSEKLLAAPPIISPTRPPTLARSGRAHSFIQPFRDPRPEVTRSLSFDHQPSLGELDDDDPFILPDTPSHTLASSSTSTGNRPSSAGGSRSGSSTRTGRITPGSAMRRNKRHTISLPSPSPFAASRHFSFSNPSSSVLKKRKDAPTSPFANPTPSGKANRNMSNSNSNSNSNQPQLRTALKPISTNVKPNYSGAFATPIKSAAFGSSTSTSTQTIPQSLTREWLQLSSPCNADAAASLGLVPTHLAPATPGLRGVIGAETPEMTIMEARAKKRRGDATPGTGIAVALGMGYGRK